MAAVSSSSTGPGPILVGEGTYGKVYRLENGTIKKVLERRDEDGDVQDCTIRETAFLFQFSHPNIIKIQDITVTPTHIELHMPDGGLNLMQWACKTDFPERMKLLPKIVYQVLCALSFIEKHNIVHSDLKPGNILIDPSSKVVRVIDWGAVSFEPKTRNECLCTHVFASPEMLDSRRFYCSVKLDVFSLGMTLHYLIYKKWVSERTMKKFAKLHSSQNIRMELFNSPDSKQKCYSFADKSFWDLCQSMLSINICHRPLASELLRSGFFDAYRSEGESTGEYTPLVPLQSPVWINVEKNNDYRTIIIKWLYEVGKKHSYVLALPLCINILDAYVAKLTRQELSGNKIQLLAIACYAIAVAICYSRTKLDDYVFLCNNIYKNRDIESAMWTVFSSLKFRVYRKTFIQDVDFVDLSIVKTILIDPDVVSKSVEEQLVCYQALSNQNES